MNKYKSEISGLQEDPDFFWAAVNFTAKRTAFAARLIEKDYFSSVLLEFLASASEALVFKGGTCLAKVYAEFYRPSEDLDFVISMPIQAKRAERSLPRTLRSAGAEMRDLRPARLRLLVLRDWQGGVRGTARPLCGLPNAHDGLQLHRG